MTTIQSKYKKAIMKRIFSKLFHLTAIISLLYGYYLISHWFTRYAHYFNSVSLQGYFLTLLVSTVQILMSSAPNENLTLSTERMASEDRKWSKTIY